MNDWTTRQIPFDMDNYLRASNKYLDEPEPELYSYRVVVEVTETYSIDVTAESEEQAEELAKQYLSSHGTDTATLDYDDADGIDSVELDEVDYYISCTSEL